MNETNSDFYINCSGAKHRKKKAKSKEKLDVFSMSEKVLKYFNNQQDILTTELETILNKLETHKIPYGIDENKVMKILNSYDLSHNPNKEISYYDMKMDMENIERIEEQLNEKPMQELLFMNEANKIINKTKEYLTTPVTINFFNKKQSTNSNQKEIDTLKLKMIQLCKQYIDFSDTEFKKQEEQQICDCGSTEFVLDNSNEYCIGCGKTFYKVFEIETSTFTDNERVSFSQKYKYKKINHFKDTIRQFTGTQNKHIDKKVLDDLQNALEKDKIIDHTLSKPFNKLTKEHLRIYLDHTGHNKYYEDINLIYHHFTGKACPKIDDNLYNKLLDDFEKLVQMFISISENTDKIERTNFLNSQYVLYQLLKKYNYQCYENDFALPRSTKCRVDQEKIYIDLCDKLHWSYVSIL